MQISDNEKQIKFKNEKRENWKTLADPAMFGIAKFGNLSISMN
jgi:hypothetical protein